MDMRNIHWNINVLEHKQFLQFIYLHQTWHINVSLYKCLQ